MEQGGGALAGVRVVELGEYLAAPILGMLCADQGADVVHVARPGAVERPAHAVWHRGKRRVSLDLGHPDDRRIARELIARADVLVEGFRPGALARAGLDPADLRAETPALITASLPGFAPDDPRAHLPAWEGAIGAIAGLYEVPLRRRPAFTPLPLASVTAALYAANGIAAALYARERDGLGQHVEVPLYDATFALQELIALFTVRPPRVWRTLQWAATPFIGPWRCADGRWLYLHAGQGPHAARLPAVLDDLGATVDAEALRNAVSAATARDPGAVASIPEALRIRRALAHAFRRRPAASWEKVLGEAGLCAVVARTGEEWLAHPHARAAGQVVTVADPHLGALVQPGLAVRLEHGPALPRPRAAGLTPPAELLAAWPERDAPPALGGEPSAPLSGLRVLDLTQVIAGPTAARTLAELGAEVWRVENPTLHAGWVQPFHVAYNPGKRSVTLDLRTEAGRDTFWRLVDHLAPDVVIDGFRAGVTDRLGIGEQAVRQRVPGVLWTRVTAYGAAGPWATHPGWEQTAQAMTGVQVDYGGDGPPRLLPVPFNDLGTGLLASWGTLLALLARRQTGEPQRVVASLTATATLYQSGWLFTHEGRTPPPRPSQDALGTGPLHRFYEARDGWLFLAAPESAVDELCTVPGLAELREAPRARWAEVLERALRTAAVSVWQARIELARLADRVAIVHRLRPSRAMGDPRALHRDLVRFREHPGLGPVTETGPPLRLSRTPCVHLAAAPVRGSDTAAAYERLGLEAPEDVPPDEAHVAQTPRTWREDVAWFGDQVRWGLFLAWTDVLERWEARRRA